MPTNGMTIDSLNTVSSLTAQDEVPVWDKEASGEPTKKITAQNMANSVKTLGSLVNTTEMNNAIAQSTADVIRTGDVVNSLTNTSTTAPLSANMGKALNDKIYNQFSGMNSFVFKMGANTSFVITIVEQHQVFIITADATGGEFPFIIAGNGGVLSLGQIGSASWNSDNTKLTVNISSARTVLILSTNIINQSWS